MCAAYVKDAIDLLQGHYIVSVTRDMNPPSQKGGLEAIAVSTIQMGQIFCLFSVKKFESCCYGYSYFGNVGINVIVESNPTNLSELMVGREPGFETYHPHYEINL